MTFAILVCAALLLTLLYFVALITGETTAWLVGRLSRTQRTPTPIQLPHR